ncbi:MULTISPECIES: hypothetical protein [unclassified Enterococcus]|uniref:hypothetical protein n=1 Tax=unclassified Enterococcus TaxID=2608891 RepID=UPI001593A8AA|nr:MULTISPECIES: hypothetical protein [unclassified Enterococcus]
MITFLNFLQKSIGCLNQIIAWPFHVLDKINMNYVSIIAVIVLFWKMLDLLLFGEEL